MLSVMWTDLLLQAALIFSTLFIFLFMYNVPQNLFSKLRLKSLGDFQAKRHFVKGAQLLGQARSTKDMALAKSAQFEADKAIALDPKDAAAFILKALTLELQGFKTSALESLDLALAPSLSRSLSGEERANALYKRAELRLGLSQLGSAERVGSMVEDLVESVKLKEDNVKAFCLLGECYEKMDLKQEAKKAYEDALKVQPNCISAQEALGHFIS